jgi:hypothetical protein
MIVWLVISLLNTLILAMPPKIEILITTFWFVISRLHTFSALVLLHPIMTECYLTRFLQATSSFSPLPYRVSPAMIQEIKGTKFVATF